jgi:hypothetical protein
LNVQWDDLLPHDFSHVHVRDRDLVLHGRHHQRFRGRDHYGHCLSPHGWRHLFPSQQQQHLQGQQQLQQAEQLHLPQVRLRLPLHSHLRH